MSHAIPYTATLPDGRQLLFTRWLGDDGTEYWTVADRLERHHSWGPPQPVELAESERDPY